MANPRDGRKLDASNGNFRKGRIPRGQEEELGVIGCKLEAIDVSVPRGVFP